MVFLMLGLYAAPTALGVELLLWAFGHGDKDLDFLLTDEFSPEIEGIPKSVPNAVPTQRHSKYNQLIKT